MLIVRSLELGLSPDHTFSPRHKQPFQRVLIHEDILACIRRIAECC